MRTSGATRRWQAASCLALLLGVSTPATADDVVVEWNKHAARLSVMPAFRLSPVQQSRVMAIVQVSVHDAVNSVTGRYETYLAYEGPPAEGVSAEAAAVGAAHHALRALFDAQAGNIDTWLASSLAALGLPSDDPGIAYGRSVAAAVLAHRASDGASAAQFAYTAPGAGDPGVWVPLTAVPALLPGWGEVTPWVLRRGSQFRPDGPPALASEQYAKDYNEVLEVGSAATSTPEQTEIAHFWRASPTTIWNDVLTQVLAARSLDLSDTARWIALFYLATADASIACWDAKYVYNFWRPLPAIRAGDADGNPFTVGDQLWAPLLATPPHPDYPSGHTTNSSAMATVLQAVFGDSPGIPLSVTVFDNLLMTNLTRHWETFSEAVDEVVDARVYSGFHFRTADEVGARLGRQVARFVLTHALGPCRGRGKQCP